VSRRPVDERRGREKTSVAPPLVEHLDGAPGVVRVSERIAVRVHLQVAIEQRAFEAYAATRFGAQELVDELVAMGQGIANSLAKEVRNFADGAFADADVFGEMRGEIRFSKSDRQGDKRGGKGHGRESP